MANLYPNDGSQMTATTKKVAPPKPKLGTTPIAILDNLLKRYDEKIIAAGSLDNIQLDKVDFGGNGMSIDRQVSIEAQLLAHQLLIQFLHDEKNYLRVYMKDEYNV